MKSADVKKINVKCQTSCPGMRVGDRE